MTHAAVQQKKAALMRDLLQRVEILHLTSDALDADLVAEFDRFVSSTEFQAHKDPRFKAEVFAHV